MYAQLTSRPGSIRRLALGLALVVSATVIGVGPAAAATPPNYGSVVRCGYQLTSGRIDQSFEARLMKIAVTPPLIYAKSGQQQVGWRFVVRRLIDEGPDPQWRTTYASPVQKGVATVTHAADFETMRVGVALPQNANPYWVYYQVRLKMFWYRPDGSVQSVTTYQMPDARLVVGGEYWENATDYWDGYCHGLLKQTFDGPF